MNPGSTEVAPPAALYGGGLLMEVGLQCNMTSLHFLIFVVSDDGAATADYCYIHLCCVLVAYVQPLCQVLPIFFGVRLPTCRSSLFLAALAAANFFLPKKPLQHFWMIRATELHPANQSHGWHQVKHVNV